MTGDALYCQRELCTQIRRQGGPYFFAVKANQPGLLDDITNLFAERPWDAVQPADLRLDRGHGREKLRLLRCATALAGYTDRPGLGMVCTIQRVVTRAGRTSDEQAEAVTCLLAPERARRIRRRLLAWGRRNFQDYSWRAETDPWLTLVAEFFLQRTRASQADRAFVLFRERFPAALDLVRQGPQAAREFTDLLGLHWRGPLLHELARQVACRGGEPPSSISDLRLLTGVGPYTAAAWLSLHRGKRAAIVDSNVTRWLARVTGKPYPRDPRQVKRVNELADRLTPQRVFRSYNYAVLDFTMQISTQKKPLCNLCPIRRDCCFGLSS